jgi:hypothetical protein
VEIAPEQMVVDLKELVHSKVISNSLLPLAKISYFGRCITLMVLA